MSDKQTTTLQLYNYQDKHNRCGCALLSKAGRLWTQIITVEAGYLRTRKIRNTERRYMRSTDIGNTNMRKSRTTLRRLAKSPLTPRNTRVRVLQILKETRL